jgi:hypothetical protein
MISFLGMELPPQWLRKAVQFVNEELGDLPHGEETTRLHEPRSYTVAPAQATALADFSSDGVWSNAAALHLFFRSHRK